MNNTDQYVARVVCTNCGEFNLVSVPKKVELSDVPCPKCGCKRLKVDSN